MFFLNFIVNIGKLSLILAMVDLKDCMDFPDLNMLGTQAPT